MSKDLSTITILLAVRDQAEALESNLPRFLEAAHEAGCRVVVVDDASTDETPDVLERMKGQYDNLYTTFLPKLVPNTKSRIQLALTVGVKAVKSERVVFANIMCPPRNKAWLERLNDDDIVLVYTGRKASDERIYSQHFPLLKDAAGLICKAERHSDRGRRGKWLKTLRGHYDAFAVGKEQMFEAAKLFGHRMRGRKLVWQQLKAMVTFLTNSPQV